MSHERERKVKDIVLKIGDRNKTVQGVTEKTTCGDVIKMVLRKFNYAKENTHSYAMFECGNGTVRMLSDKTKVLKTMRSWGSGNSQFFSLKTAPKTDRSFKAKQDKTRKAEPERNNLDVTNKIESAAKLAHFAQSQKTRLLKHRSRSHVTELYRDDSETRVDEFISNVDQTKMAGFLDYCGSVTANELVRLSGLSDNSKPNERVPSNGFVSAQEIKRVDSINDVKYATKKVLKPKRVPVTYRHTDARMSRKHTFVDCELRNVPIHSTPIRCNAKPNIKRHEAIAEDVATKIARLDQREHKDIILQKYFADYLSYNSPHRKPFPMPKRELGDGAETSLTSGNSDKGDGAFSTSTPVCSNTARARRHSDSDSGQEDHDQEENLDNAFFCKTVTRHFDSTCSYRYAHIKPLSRKLVNYDVTMATNVEKLVDYSLSDSSVLESSENSVVFDVLERNVFDEDKEMASFMDSKLHDDFSDEGLSSLGCEDEHY